MPFDGAGNYTPSPAPNFPAIGGTTINSTYYNNVINDLATALSLCITRDGQGKPSANIDWNNKNLSNVATLGAVTLAISGAAGITGNVTVGGTLGVTGNTTLGGTLGVTGNTALGVVTTGALTASNVQCTNNATVGGTLNVTGVTTLGTAVANNLTTTANIVAGTSVHAGTSVDAATFLLAGTVVVAGSDIVARGKVSEGGQLVLGYTNNTTVSVSGNNTWNTDVDNANTFRIFRINNAGTTAVYMALEEAAGVAHFYGGTIYVGASDKLILQHDGIDGYCRSQLGTMNFGASGLLTFQLTSAFTISSKPILDTSGTPAWGTSTNQVATTAFVDRFRGIPSSASAGKTAVVSDRGTCIKATGAITFDSGVFAADDVVTVYANQAGTVTLTQGAGMTMRLGGSATTGSRTLNGRGFATIYFISGSECVVTGSVS